MYADRGDIAPVYFSNICLQMSPILIPFAIAENEGWEPFRSTPHLACKSIAGYIVSSVATQIMANLLLILAGKQNYAQTIFLFH